jgi:hypothetical protein
LSGYNTHGCHYLSKAANMPHDNPDMQETLLPYKTDDCEKQTRIDIWENKKYCPNLSEQLNFH